MLKKSVQQGLAPDGHPFHVSRLTFHEFTSSENEAGGFFQHPARNGSGSSATVTKPLQLQAILR